MKDNTICTIVHYLASFWPVNQTYPRHHPELELEDHNCSMLTTALMHCRTGDQHLMKIFYSNIYEEVPSCKPAMEVRKYFFRCVLRFLG